MAACSKPLNGFSLVEALVALTLIGLASSTLLLATASTVQSGADASARTIARGIAEQMIDEILGQRYHEQGTSARGALGPESGETATPPRTLLFDDADDYANFESSPLRDSWGMPLGQGNGLGGLRATDFRLPDNYFAQWKVRITITYVNESDPTKDLSGLATSVVRAVRIQVTRNWNGTDQELVSLRRVIAYVPPVLP
jgi:type II secretory pathway pseudopilin PulG